MPLVIVTLQGESKFEIRFCLILLSVRPALSHVPIRAGSLKAPGRRATLTRKQGDEPAKHEKAQHNRLNKDEKVQRRDRLDMY